jgi:phage portal protein BeeE
MRLPFGFELKRKSAPPDIAAVYGGGRGWNSLGWIGEPFTGAWQQNVHVSHDRVLANWTVFACMTLIAGDVGKMRIKLMEQDAGGIKSETSVPAFSPVLARPNAYQTRQKFIESWILSKLAHGNTYVLKERDNRGVVVGLYVLDPTWVIPKVAADGAIYYQLKRDYLAGLDGDEIVAPSSEIIHDRMWCLFHPLIGLSPIYASGLAATQGLEIQQNSAVFFKNLSRPSGHPDRARRHLRRRRQALLGSTGRRTTAPARSARRPSSAAVSSTRRSRRPRSIRSSSSN